MVTVANHPQCCVRDFTPLSSPIHGLPKHPCRLWALPTLAAHPTLATLPTEAALLSACPKGPLFRGRLHIAPQRCSRPLSLPTFCLSPQTSSLPAHTLDDPEMDDLLVILPQLQQALGESQGVPLSSVNRFVEHASAVKKDIVLALTPSQDPTQPPVFLPPAVAKYLSKAAGIAPQHIQPYWNVLKELAWNDVSNQRRSEHPENTFRRCGIPHGISACMIGCRQGPLAHSTRRPAALHTFYPPYRYCEHCRCQPQGPKRSAQPPALRHATSQRVLYYTLGDGVLPAHAVFLKCSGTSAVATLFAR